MTISVFDIEFPKMENIDDFAKERGLSANSGEEVMRISDLNFADYNQRIIDYWCSFKVHLISTQGNDPDKAEELKTRLDELDTIIAEHQKSVAKYRRKNV